MIRPRRAASKASGTGGAVANKKSSPDEVEQKKQVPAPEPKPEPREEEPPAEDPAVGARGQAAA